MRWVFFLCFFTILSFSCNYEPCTPGIKRTCVCLYPTGNLASHQTCNSYTGNWDRCECPKEPPKSSKPFKRECNDSDERSCQGSISDCGCVIKKEHCIFKQVCVGGLWGPCLFDKESDELPEDQFYCPKPIAPCRPIKSSTIPLHHCSTSEPIQCWVDEHGRYYTCFGRRFHEQKLIPINTLMSLCQNSEDREKYGYSNNIYMICGACEEKSQRPPRWKLSCNYELFFPVKP